MYGDIQLLHYILDDYMVGLKIYFIIIIYIVEENRKALGLGSKYYTFSNC